MKKRNIILEGRIKSLLRVTDVSSMTVYQQGMLLLAVEKLYKATEDEDYRQWAEEKLCELIGEDGQIKTPAIYIPNNEGINRIFIKINDLLSPVVGDGALCQEQDCKQLCKRIGNSFALI